MHSRSFQMHSSGLIIRDDDMDSTDRTSMPSEASAVVNQHAQSEREGSAHTQYYMSHVFFQHTCLLAPVSQHTAHACMNLGVHEAGHVFDSCPDRVQNFRVFLGEQPGESQSKDLHSLASGTRAGTHRTVD